MTSDRLVAPIAPVTGEAADLLTLIRTLDLGDYVTLIEHLRAEDRDDPTLFGPPVARAAPSRHPPPLTPATRIRNAPIRHHPASENQRHRGMTGRWID